MVLGTAPAFIEARLCTRVNVTDRLPDPLVRNRQARQAGRRLRHRPPRRHGGARHRLPRGQPARRHRLPAAHGRLPRIHLRVGPHPGRLLQARRQAGREGSAHEPRDRPADPAAVPAPAGATRRRSSRWSSRPTRRTTPTCSRITGASAALAHLGDSVREDDRRRPRRPRGRPVRHQPHLRAAQAEPARPRSSPAARTAS